VQTKIGSQWENTWSEEEVDGKRLPWKFNSAAEAEEEIDEFFDDLRRAGMVRFYNREDYRVAICEE
jgi:hypothetical protein